MRRTTLILAVLLTLGTVADSAEAGYPRRPAAPSAARGNGVWQKRDGWGGYGWYSIYGDFVGTDGYTYTATRYRGMPGNPGGWYLGPGRFGPFGASGYGVNGRP
jgi:hypothetical protein